MAIMGGGSVAMHTVIFISNEAPVGGAVTVTPGGTFDIDTSVFQGNWAAARGGGVATEQASISVSNCTFDDNSAGGLGAALHIDQPPSVQIADSTFEPFAPGAGSVFIGGQLAGCDEHPCGLGFGCSYSQYSLTCTRCSSTTASTDGKACRACNPGTGPSADSTACLPCAGNAASLFGVCESCAAGFASNDAHTQCMDMSDGGLSDATIITDIVDGSLGGHLVAVTVDVISADGTEPDVLGDLATAAITDELGISNVSIAVARTDFADSAGPSTQGRITFMLVDQSDETLNQMLYGLTEALQPDSNSSLPVLFDRVAPTFGFVCPRGMVRLEGQTTCNRCPWPEFTEDQVSCEVCPLNMVPTETGDSCKCRESYFITANEDETERFLTCHSMDYVKPEILIDDLNLQCKACIGDEFGCVSACKGQDVTVMPGWQSLASAEAGEQNIFSCIGGAKACPGGPIDSTECGPGYAGLLCSTCAPGFHERSNACLPCESVTPAGAAASGAAIVIVLLLAWKVKLWYNYFTIFAEISGMVTELELKAIFKQITATIQILSGLGPVLAVTFPDFFSIELGRFASFFKIDISVLLGLGCYTVNNSYAVSLLVNIATVALVAITIVSFYSLRLRQLVHGQDSPEEVREHALDLYSKFDRDGKGISEIEVKQIAMQIDPDVSDASIKKMFDAADTHNTGSIDFEEFIAAVNSPHTDEFSLDDLIYEKRQFDLKTDALGRLFMLVFVM